MTPTETATILRQFNGWRRDLEDKFEQPDAREISEAIDAAVEMIERLEAAESECFEEARLNGMGASREAALMANLEAAEKDIALKEKLIDALGLGLNAAAHERDNLRAELADLRSSMTFRTSLIGRIEAERDALRAKIERMEQQEQARLVTPTAYRWRYRGAIKWQYGELTEEVARLAKEHNHEVQPLGILPDAQGEEK